MHKQSSVADEHQLTLVFRVEAGCLGPDGADHITAFCQYAHKELLALDTEYLHREILPRQGQHQPELQYLINRKSLTRDKAGRYLKLFDTTVEDVESHIHKNILLMIEQYMKLHT